MGRNGRTREKKKMNKRKEGKKQKRKKRATKEKKKGSITVLCGKKSLEALKRLFPRIQPPFVEKSFMVLFSFK